MSGSAGLSVKADSGSALMALQASGSGGDGELKVEVSADEDAKLSLVEGGKAFTIINDGSADNLVVSDGLSELIRVGRGDGATTVRFGKFGS